MTARRRAALLPRCAAAVVVCVLGPCANPAEASIRVEVNGVEGQARDNVLAYLSVERYATLDDLAPDLVERLFHRAESEVADALRPFGYYAPKLDATLTPDGKNWIARLTITPGEPVRLDSATVTIDGPGAEEPFLRELVDATPLRAGSQLDHGVYERLKSELQRRAAANGYLDARYTQSRLDVDPKRLRATVALTLDTGLRYRFGAVDVEQDAVNPAFINRFLRFHQGDWFDSAALLRTQFALDDTQYFRIVEVLPGDRDPATLTVPVRIDARRNKSNKYTLGVGYETDFGPRMRFAWNRRLVNRRGHRFRLESNLAGNNQQVTGSYVVPIGDPALEKAQLDLTASNTVLADVRIKSLALRPSLTHVLGRWQRVTFVDLLRTESIAGGVPTRDTLVVPGVSFAPVPPAFTGDGTTVNITQGFYAEALGSAAALGSGSNFLRLRVRDEWRHRLAPRWWLLGRGELGVTLARHFEDLPTQYRFFAGGDRSVRGFSYNSLSPVAVVPGTTPPQLLRTGGKHLAVGSVEIERDLPRNFAVAVFADAGNAFNRFGDPLEYSAGIGVRYKLPFVSVGIDVAQPLSRRGSPRLHINIGPVL